MIDKALDSSDALEKLTRTIARQPAKIYQLALWKDPQRGIPNEFARSALFAAVSLNKPRHLERVEIFSQNGFKVEYTGKQLTQSDLDVFEAVMHLARGTSEGTYIKFRARTLLNMIGRHSGKSQYEWLLTVLSNLTATSVAITRDKQAVFWGSILPRGAAKLGDDAMFTVEINRDLIGLFKRGYTVVEWDQRKQLLRKPLAQHLHAWICSHDRPHAVSVSYVRQLSGSATKNLSKFRQSLRFALSAIKAVGAITDWAIDSSDRVHIKKAPPALDAEVTAE